MKCPYDKTIGYSPLENVDLEKLRNLIEVNSRIIEGFFRPEKGGAILVAGAGQGDEAEIIYERYGLRTIGVDINIMEKKKFDNSQGVVLQRQDLLHLAFKNDVFNLIYSYHVLEHVSDPLAALREMERVLMPGGVLFIGFPNKHRLFSYIGTSQKASLLDKLKWNVNDYLFRLRGKFENKYGAHAGFSEKEFVNLASGVFPSVYPVRNRYMLYKYARISWLIHAMIRSRTNEIFFPSNYYICMKGQP